MNYVAILYKDENSDYGVVFPDFPGCVTAGKTLEEAKDMAREALIGHIEVMRECGERVPSPSPLDNIMNDKHFKNGIAFLVDAPSEKSVRVNITFPKNILEIIDRRANRHHLSRSAFLAEAALSYQKKGGISI